VYLPPAAVYSEARMHWSEIEGWFQWRSAQEEAAEKFSEGSCFVEVGTYLGRSLCSLGEIAELSPAAGFPATITTRLNGLRSCRLLVSCYQERSRGRLSSGAGSSHKRKPVMHPSVLRPRAESRRRYP
jgi:hypothetical protein